MKTLKYLVFLLGAVFIFIACQKESSLENGLSGGNAIGSLSSKAGQCDSTTEIHGEYVRDSVMKDSNYVLIRVNFQSPGLYKIVTETENGFAFYDSGFMINTGMQNIKLKAVGKPIAKGNTSFLVIFDTSFCSFTISVSDTPIKKATFTIDSATGCGIFAGAGTYKVGTPLNGAINYISLPVTVIRAGTYTLTSVPHNGMTFSGSGIFNSPGSNQTIILRGSGTPLSTSATLQDTIKVTTTYTLNGITNIHTCSYGFTIDTLGGGGTGPTGPTAADSAWSFSQGTPFYFGPMDTGFVSTLPPIGTYATLLGTTYATGDTSININIPATSTTIAPGTYNTSANAVFTFADSSGNIIFNADPTTSGVNVIVIVSSFNSSTSIVTGTFSGTAKNSTGASVPITGGKFTTKVQF